MQKVDTKNNKQTAKIAKDAKRNENIFCNNIIIT